MTFKNKNTNENLQNILLAVALIIGFVFIVSISIYIIKEKYGLTCACKVSLPILIAVLTSLGVFVGILTYYFLSKAFSKEKNEIYENIEKTLNFLNHDEKTIILAIIDNNGEITQSKLSNVTKIDAVRLYRKLSSLVSKNILHKKKKGMTNQIVLNDDFRELFIK